ncbi:F-box protein, helicase, 18, partial [Phenoliferia sp. Uapishka_3]
MRYKHLLDNLRLVRHAARQTPPVMVNGRMVASPAHLEYDKLHAAALKSFGLVPHPIGPNWTWRHDVLSALQASGQGDRWATPVLGLLEGKMAIQTTAAGVRQELKRIDGIVGKEEMIALVLATLDLRSMEVPLLDPMARSFRTILRLYLDGLLDSPRSSSSHNKLDWKTRSTPTPTAEQLAIIQSPITPGVTRINSFAGTGKTTALVQKAEEHFRTNPNHHILYLAFNKSVQEKAATAFAHLPNVECRTIGSIAYRHLNERFGQSFRKKCTDEKGTMRKLDPASVVHLLNIKDGRYLVPWTGQKEDLKAKVIAKRTITSLETFANKSDPWEPQIEHMFLSTPDRPQVPAEELLRLTRALWRMVYDLSKEDAPLPFEYHVKMCLLDPSFKLRKYDRKYDIIMLDEAQSGTNIKRFIGIEMWRGATNRFSRIDAAPDLHLSQSHRFGALISKATNDILAHKNEDVPITGTGKLGQIYRPHPQAATVAGGLGSAVIFRTNAGLENALLEHALTLDLTSKQAAPTIDLYMRSEGRDSFFALYHHAHLLCLGISGPVPRGHSWSKALSPFGSWEELQAGAAELAKEGSDLWPEDRELVRVAQRGDILVRKDFAERLELVRKSILPETCRGQGADIVLGTTHQMKGLEFDRVILADDFSLPNLLPGNREEAEEPLNLLYVAFTRARDEVITNPALIRILLDSQGAHQFYFEKDSNTLCKTCKSSSQSTIHYSTPFPCASIPSTLTSPNSHHSLADEFPACTACASNIPYKPLQDFIAFQIQSHQEICDDPSGDHVEAMCAAKPTAGPAFECFRKSSGLLERAAEKEKEDELKWWGNFEEEEKRGSNIRRAGRSLLRPFSSLFRRRR